MAQFALLNGKGNKKFEVKKFIKKNAMAVHFSCMERCVPEIAM